MDNRLVGNPSLYNEKKTWPDLTIELADGRSIKVHRLVLSKAKNYFETLCNRLHVGEEHHSVRKLYLKSLSPQSAAAVVAFVRAIYGFRLPPAGELVWATWFDIALYAPNHLDPEVSEEAAQKFMTSCLEQPDPNEVVKILQTLYQHNNPTSIEYIEKIREHHEHKLLRNESYLADARLSDRDTLLQHLSRVLDKLEQGSIAT